jgi:hypothetical protein
MTVRLEEQMYGYILTMIVQIVLVIVTAGQVNSQLCPSVCRCNDDLVSCTDLFSDVTNTTQETFLIAVQNLQVSGSTRLELEEDLFLRRKITSLKYVDLSHNNITKIWQRAFYSLADLVNLDLSDNSITTLHSHTFYYNTRLVTLYLERNSITDIHPSTFRNNSRLRDLYMSGNKINSIEPDTFIHNTELGWLDL